MRVSKLYNFDCETIKLMGGRCIGAEVEKAVLEYAKNPAEDPVKERNELPLSKMKKGAHLVMEYSTFEMLKKMTNSKRIESTIIEVAIWRHWKWSVL